MFILLFLFFVIICAFAFLKSGGKQKQIIIHIAGPSGVGKTHMLNELNYETKDLDDFNDNIKGTIEYKEKYWLKKFSEQIDDFIKNKKIIIFGGHCSNFGFYKFTTKYKFFIDIPYETVKKQRKQRGEKEETDWIKSYNEDRKLYKKHHYKFLSYGEILKEIKKIISNFQKFKI